MFLKVLVSTNENNWFVHYFFLLPLLSALGNLFGQVSSGRSCSFLLVFLSTRRGFWVFVVCGFFFFL